jgi:hypothetical protein
LCLRNLQIVALWASSSCLRSFPKHPLCSQKFRLSCDVIFMLSFSLIISSSFPCFDSFCVHLSPCFFFYYLLSFMVLLSYLASCAGLLSLGLVTENSACWNLKYEVLMHEIHPHRLAGAGLLLLGRHVWCIWILHEKMIQVHIYLWTGSSRGQDRTLSILDREEEP